MVRVGNILIRIYLIKLSCVHVLKDRQERTMDKSTFNFMCLLFRSLAVHKCFPELSLLMASGLNDKRVILLVGSFFLITIEIVLMFQTTCPKSFIK